MQNHRLLRAPHALCREAYPLPLPTLSVATLSVAHEYFQPLAEVIEWVELHPRFFTQDVRQIVLPYREFIEQVIATTGEQRLQLMEGRALESGTEQIWQVDTLHEAVRLRTTSELIRLLPTSDLDWQDSEGNTALHVAVAYGQFNHMRLLLKGGANPNLINRDKETPLVLAIKNGHIPFIDPLLDSEAFLYIEIQHLNVLHLSATEGAIQCIEHLHKRLEEHQFRELLQEPDQHGNLPLHCAVDIGADRSIIDLFLEEYPAGMDQTNNRRETPLLLAGKRGNITGARLLLQRGASTEIADQEGCRPLDAAIEGRRWPLVQLLLDPDAEVIPEDPPPTDALAYFTKKLIAAREQRQAKRVVYYLLILSEEHRLKDGERAAWLTNTALNLAPEPLRPQLIHREERFKGYVLKAAEQAIGHQFSLETDTLKDTLANYRKWARTRFEKGRCSAIETANYFTSLCKTFFAQMVEETARLLGNPPCEWGVICFGSMAREEMCLYSDVEWAILVRICDRHTRPWFDHLANIMRMRVICIGESIPKDLFPDEPIAPLGFRFDTTSPPLDDYRQTPEKIASLQELEHPEDVDPKINLLRCAALVETKAYGEKELFNEYEAALAAQIDGHGWSLVGSKPARKALGLKLIRATCAQFSPQLSKEYRAHRAFGIKKEFYRPLQEGIAALAIYFNLQSKSTAARILELGPRDRDRKIKGRGIFSKEGCQHLQEALELALRLRLAAHCKYESEAEIIMHPAGVADSQDDRIFVASEEQVAYISRIYTILIPFVSCLEAFAKTEKRRELRGLFIQDDFAQLAEQAAHLATAAEADRHLDHALAINPYDAQALFIRGTNLLDSDEEAGLHLLDQAANWGHLQASLQLGLRALSNQDYDRSMFYLRQAHERGSADAGYHLADSLLRGPVHLRDPLEAIAILRPLAIDRHRRASGLLGWCYLEGIGVDQSLHEAHRLLRLGNWSTETRDWLALCVVRNPTLAKSQSERKELVQEAADRKVAEAMHCLSKWYTAGKLVKENLPRARELLEQSATLGFPRAQYELAIRSRAKEPEQAFTWMEQAAEAKWPQALFELGLWIYTDGNQEEGTLQRASQLFEHARQLGVEGAAHYCRLCLAGSAKEMAQQVAAIEVLEANPSEDPEWKIQLASLLCKQVDGEAQERAIALIKPLVPKHARATLLFAEALIFGTGIKADSKQAVELLEGIDLEGQPQGAYLLGYCLAKGAGCRPDPIRAAALLQQADRQQIARASFELALLYLEDKDTAPLARPLLEKAARQGITIAKFRLAKLLDPSEHLRRLTLFEEAARARIPESFYYLGKCYLKGHGVSKDESRARGYFDQGHHLGDPNAALGLGHCLVHGIGGKHDRNGARKLYEEAAKLGHPVALFRLGKMHESLPGGRGLTEAKQYYRAAAGKKHRGALFALSQLSPADVTPELVEAAELGHKEAQLQQGRLLFKQRQYDAAMAFLLPCAKRGVVEAHRYCAKYFLRYHLPNKAISHLQAAAERGSVADKQMYGIALIQYTDDRGQEGFAMLGRLPPNDETRHWRSRYYIKINQHINALNNLEENVRRGYTPSLFSLATCLIALNSDGERAKELMQRAAKLNDSEACLWLGRAYLKGNKRFAIPKTPHLAIALLRRARGQEREEAQLLIGCYYEEESKINPSHLTDAQEAYWHASKSSDPSTKEKADAGLIRIEQMTALHTARQQVLVVRRPLVDHQIPSASPPSAESNRRFQQMDFEATKKTLDRGANPYAIQRAYSHLKTMADSGYQPACRVVADCLETGRGVEANLELAKTYRQRALKTI